MTYIDSNNKIYCFNTISIYNNIISCIKEKKDPDNPYNRVKLTAYDIFTICDNLSKLTVNEEVLLGANQIKIYYYLDLPVIINDDNKLFNKLNLLLNLLRIRWWFWTTTPI